MRIISIAIAVFLNVAGVYASDFFNIEDFPEHEQCNNFLDALTFLGKLTEGDINGKRTYTLRKKCIQKKVYYGRQLVGVQSICPNQEIDDREVLIDAPYLSTSAPTIKVSHKKHPANEWKNFVPCKRYQDFKFRDSRIPKI